MAIHKVIIVGGGFGGLYAAKAFGKLPVDLTVVDRRNYHLFQPLLYQVATGALSPGEIASPIRHVLHRQKNTRVLMGEVVDIDTAAKEVVLRRGDREPYDTLIVATGATHHYFGHPEWEQNAPGLKNIEDATEMRGKILAAFEHAELEHDPALRQAWLTFVVVGGGATGVELAGALGEIANETCSMISAASIPGKLESSWSKARIVSSPRFPRTSRITRKNRWCGSRCKYACAPASLRSMPMGSWYTAAVRTKRSRRRPCCGRLECARRR